jgi:hypothetical protein
MNKHKLNILKMSDNVRLILLIEKDNRKNVKRPINSIFYQIHYRKLLKRKILMIKNILMFNCRNIRKMKMTLYLDMNKYLLKWFTQFQDKNILYRVFKKKFLLNIVA